jgi:hypothetical protein
VSALPPTSLINATLFPRTEEFKARIRAIVARRITRQRVLNTDERRRIVLLLCALRGGKLIRLLPLLPAEMYENILSFLEPDHVN